MRSSKLGSYEVIKALHNHHYIVRQINEHEGPFQTSSATDYMRSLVNDDDNVENRSENKDKEKKESERLGRLLSQNG